MTSTRVRRFLVSAKDMPVRDSFTRAALLVALQEAQYTEKRAGVSVQWLAGQISAGPEVVRHHLRVLRAEGAAVVISRIGRTELFAINAETNERLTHWIGEFY